MKSSVITTKGQIVIPKDIREKYKLKPGTKVYFEETEDRGSVKTRQCGFYL
ncbi:MAG: AbrB/MazE/SpoVT family DNA-binding domain-containing protein [Ginsengibacter sp.]